MLAYNDLGAGIPIVLIHGLGSKKEAWMPQHELSNQYRLVIPDLRGHGETVINADFTIQNFALDIIQLLEHLQIPSAFICGLSLGGMVAQELYKQRPEMVRGLILSNTTSYIPLVLANSIIERSGQLMKQDKEELIDYIIETGLYDGSYKEEARKAFTIRDTYMDAARATMGINYFPVLPSIKKPVLLIGGTHDQITPCFNLFMMKAFLRNAETAILQNTGHLSNIEKRELFNQYVIDFIAAAA